MVAWMNCSQPLIADKPVWIIDAYGIEQGTGRILVTVDDGQELPAVVAWDDLTFSN